MPGISKCDPCPHVRFEIVDLRRVGENEYIFRCKHPEVWIGYFKVPTNREKTTGRVIRKGRNCQTPYWCPLTVPPKETK